MAGSLRSADVFPVVASLPPKINWLIFGGREATTGNTSALRRLRGRRLFEREGKRENREITSLRAPCMYWGALIPLKIRPKAGMIYGARVTTPLLSI